MVTLNKPAPLFYDYKTPAARNDGRPQTVALLILAAIYLHRGCMERASSPINSYVVVPSTKNVNERPYHPLADLLRANLTTRVKLAEITTQAIESTTRAVTPARFSLTTAPRRGEHVLIIDDTWTTGSNVESMTQTLRNSGAGYITALVAARWLDPVWQPTTAFVKSVAAATPYDANICPVTGGKCPVS